MKRVTVRVSEDDTVVLLWDVWLTAPMQEAIACMLDGVRYVNAVTLWDYTTQIRVATHLVSLVQFVETLRLTLLDDPDLQAAGLGDLVVDVRV